MKSPLIVALDVPSKSDALALMDILDADRCRIKVGKELFIAEGPSIIEALHHRGFEVFLDLKLFDIPNTVASAVKVAAELGVWMLTLHASGGSRMLEAALDALKGYRSPPLLIGVTVLTSMDDAYCHELGLAGGVSEQVLRLAKLCQQVGLPGCVCSAQEAELIRSNLGRKLTLVTPGIRIYNDVLNVEDDQIRITSPAEAIQKGSDYLVVGRPITKASDPQVAVELILSQLNL